MAVSELRKERGRESWLEPTSAREAKSGGRGFLHRAPDFGIWIIAEMGMCHGMDIYVLLYACFMWLGLFGRL
jgi:hypothetical protein